MVLADTDSTGWIVASGTLVTAVVGALVILFKNRHDQRRETRKDSLEEWQRIANRLEEQNDRAQQVIGQHQEAIQAISEEHAECREENVELRQAVTFIYNTFRYLHTQAVKSGAFDPGPLPEMPKLRDPRPESRTAYLVRQAAQSTTLLQQTNKAMKDSKGGATVSA